MEDQSKKTKRTYKKRASFAQSEDKNIIQFVKENEVLHNKKHKNFKNSIVKDLLWQNIAEQIGKPIADVKLRWKHLRDYEQKKAKNKKLVEMGCKQIKDEVYDCEHQLDDDHDESLRNDPLFLHTVLFDYAANTNLEDLKKTKDIIEEDETVDDSEPPYSTSDENSLQQFSDEMALPACSKNTFSSSTENSNKMLHVHTKDTMKNEMQLAKQCQMDHTNLLKEIVKEKINPTKESPMRMHFEAFCNSVEALPPHIKKKCERKLYAACFEIIAEHEDLVETDAN